MNVQGYSYFTERRATDKRWVATVEEFPGLQAESKIHNRALNDLYAQHGELRERIADGDGSLRRFVNVYLKGEDIRFLEGLDTEVADGDEVTILPAVAGG